MDPEAPVETLSAAQVKSYVDTAYILVCAVGVSIITPGIGMLYAGMIRRKNALTIITQSVLTTCVIALQWWIWGYSLGNTSNGKMLGNLSLAFMMGSPATQDEFPLDEVVEEGIPTSVHFIFTAFFAICTVQIFAGAIAERGRLISSQIVGFIFATVVYCPLSYWFWMPDGWLNAMGVLDFAGGGPVHIASGTGALAYALYLGKRIDDNGEASMLARAKPHNPTLVLLGTLLIWFGWLFFNSGTLLAVSSRTGYIMLNTQLAACTGGVIFSAVDKWRYGRVSLIGLCEGVICGLVAITPACGFVSPWFAVVGAIITSCVCCALSDINKWIGIDDTIRSFNIHAIGGIMGSICTAFFADPAWAQDDIPGGWVKHNWIQLGHELAAVTTCVAWSFVLTYIICFIVDHIPGLKLRLSAEEEVLGTDLKDLSEKVEYMEDSLWGNSPSLSREPTVPKRDTEAMA